MPKFEVTYALPYLHVVTVGVTAKDKETAEAKTEKGFHNGSLWDNTEAMPLLYDDYEEQEGCILEFEAAAVANFGPKGQCVRAAQFQSDAESLVEALAGEGIREHSVLELHKYIQAARKLVARRDDG